MAKRLLGLVLVLTLGSVANAQVEWNWTGAGGDQYWETAANWTQPTTTSWTYPSDEYSTTSNPSLINLDITAINIANATVDKTRDDTSVTPKLNSDLYLGGNYCILTLDNATLEIGDDVKTGRSDDGAALESTVNILNGSTFWCGDQLRMAEKDDSVSTFNVRGGSTLEADTYVSVGRHQDATATINIESGSKLTTHEAYIADDGTGTVNVSGDGSLFEVTNYARIGYDSLDDSSGNAQWGTVVIDGEGAKFRSKYSVHLGDKDYTAGKFTIKNKATAEVGTRLRVADDNHSVGILEVLNGSTLTTGVKEDSDEGYLAIAYADYSTATVNISGGSTVTAEGDRIYVGRAGTATLNLTGSTLASGTDFRVGQNGSSVGTLNVSGASTLNVGRDLETFVDASSNQDETVVSPDEGIALIHIIDGDVNIEGYCSLGHSVKGGTSTTFIVDAGTVDIGFSPDTADDLVLGWRDTDANVELQLNGGEMTVAGSIMFGSTTDAIGDPITPTGEDNGQLRILVDGGVLQGEDLVYSGNTSDSLLVLTAGFLKVNGGAISEMGMEDLIDLGNISCPNGYQIYTEGGYTVLTAVPEPTSLALILAGLGFLAMLRRK
jgi:T5SS/PEP-CTERM-associated repeat protein